VTRSSQICTPLQQHGSTGSILDRSWINHTTSVSFDSKIQWKRDLRCHLWLKTKCFITIGIMYTNQLPFCLLRHEVSSYDVCRTLRLNILQDTHNWIVKKMFLCIAWYNINIYAIKQQVKIPFQWTFNLDELYTGYAVEASIWWL